MIKGKSPQNLIIRLYKPATAPEIISESEKSDAINDSTGLAETNGMVRSRLDTVGPMRSQAITPQ